MRNLPETVTGLVVIAAALFLIGAAIDDTGSVLFLAFVGLMLSLVWLTRNRWKGRPL